MNDLLNRVWNLLEPGERPDKLEPQAGGWRYGSVWWEAGEAAVYALICQAAERKLHVAGGMSQMLCSKDTWNGSGRRATDEWEWRAPYQSYASPDRLTAAALAIEAGKGEA